MTTKESTKELMERIDSLMMPQQESRPMFEAVGLVMVDTNEEGE